jgi:transcriptional regulator with XRE-family HTH domain
MELGERLRKLRRAKGLSQARLADAIGMTATTISRVEKGEQVPSAKVVVGLAEFFGVSSDYLLGLISEKQSIPPEVKGFFERRLGKGFESTYKEFLIWKVRRDLFSMLRDPRIGDNILESSDSGESRRKALFRFRFDLSREVSKILSNMEEEELEALISDRAAFAEVVTELIEEVQRVQSERRAERARTDGGADEG